MKIEALPLYDEQISLVDFEKKHGYEMVVKQRTPEWASKPGYGKWYAQFVGANGYGLSICESPEALPGMTTGFVSDGNTPAEAVAAHLKRLSGQVLVPDLADRTKDFRVGEITYDPAAALAAV